MASVLTISGVTINRYAAKVILNRLILSLDRADEFEFTELATILPGAYHPEEAVTLTVDGVLAFSGWIVSRHPCNMGVGSISVGYRCLGLMFAAYLIPITASDGTGTMVFDLPSTVQGYTPTQAGLSIGDILTEVFNQHSTQLTANGITSFSAPDLAALTVVPPEAVFFQGNSLWSSVEQLLQQWYGSKYAGYITAAGVIRVINTTTLGATTLTLDTDPVILGSISEDTSECYTQVILRGRDDVEGAYLSLHDGTLVEGWSAGDEAAWKIDDFLHPKSGWDTGDITAITSTTITVQSDSATRTWGVNFWSGIQGQVALIDPVATGITGFEYRHITANTALTAGGTSVLTLDRPLVNSAYTRYQARGTPSGISEVWRKYTIPNTWVAQHLQPQFNFSVPWSPSEGVVVMVNYPVAAISYTQGGLDTQFPLEFEVVPYDGVNDGYIRFVEPVVRLNNTATALATGGGAVLAPTDIQVLVPYSRGTIQVQAPVSGYAGTAFTEFNVQRTLFRDYPSWINAGNSPDMLTLANEILDTVCNIVVEGAAIYFGKYAAVLTPGTFKALNVAKATGTTGYEAIAAPVRTVGLEWPQTGASEWVTRLFFSTRRQQYSGDRLYAHPNFTDGPSWFQGDAMGGAGNLVFVNPVTTSGAALEEHFAGMTRTMAGIQAAGDRATQEALRANDDAFRAQPGMDVGTPNEFLP